jgi:hypothetical protein
MGSFYKPVNESQTVSATADKSITGFWWKHNATKGLANINNAGLWLWNKGFKTKGGKFNGDEAGTLFSDLTRNEKLELIELYLKDVYIGIAKQQGIDTAVDTARDAAIAESETLFELSNGA